MARKERRTNGEKLGVSALTLAISAFFVAVFTPVASLFMLIVSLIFSIIQQRNNPNKLGKAALIISIIGLVLVIAFIVVMLILISNGAGIVQ